jgi:hypothetical protein
MPSAGRSVMLGVGGSIGPVADSRPPADARRDSQGPRSGLAISGAGLALRGRARAAGPSPPEPGAVLLITPGCDRLATGNAERVCQTSIALRRERGRRVLIARAAGALFESSR